MKTYSSLTILLHLFKDELSIVSSMDKQLPGRSESLWIGTTKGTNYPEISGTTKVDVAIVGGGIAGITAAYFLANQGKKVAVVEGSRIVTGTSGNTTAKVTSLHGVIYDFLKSNFGIDGARIYADSNQWAVNEIENIVKKESIECNFIRADAYTYSNSKKNIEEIKKEVETAHLLGLPVIYKENITLLPFPIKAAIAFTNQASFHPRKFLLVLADIIVKKGNFIYENTRALDIREGEPCEVITENAVMKAKDVIIATNFPFYDKGFFFARMNQKRSYAYAIEINKDVPNDMFLGLGNNEPSVRSYKEQGKTWVIVGGEDHVAGKDGNATIHYKKLEETIHKLFPLKSIDYRWAAQDSSSIDRVPYIGRENPTSQHVFVTTGFDEWGMTKSIVSAKILTDLIMGIKNDWASFYNPSRLNIKASYKKFLQYGKDTAKGYLDTILKPKTEEISSLKKGEGKVISKNREKLAVYKDENGALNAISAVCTHMGCIVDWNNGDKTWDCPCHGSRYTKEGKVINGPAVKPLSPKKIT